MSPYAHLFLIFGFCCLVSNSRAGDNLLPPPPDCPIIRLGNDDYVKGEVYLSAHRDTLALQEFGFRCFQFVGRSFRSVKYFALWPVTVDVKALPEAVTGLNYDVPPDEMALMNIEAVVPDRASRIALFEVPVFCYSYPHVSEIRGSAVDNFGWLEGGAYNSALRGGGSSYSTRWYSGGFRGGGSCSGGRCSFGSKLRPNDFGILRGYARGGDGQLYRR